MTGRVAVFEPEDADFKTDDVPRLHRDVSRFPRLHDEALLLPLR